MREWKIVVNDERKKSVKNWRARNGRHRGWDGRNFKLAKLRKNARSNKGERNNAENPVIEKIRVFSGNGFVGQPNDPQLQFLFYHLTFPPASCNYRTFFRAFVRICPVSISILIKQRIIQSRDSSIVKIHYFK